MCSELKQGREGLGWCCTEEGILFLQKTECSPPTLDGSDCLELQRTHLHVWLAHTHNLKLKINFKKTKKQANSSEAGYGLMKLLRGIWVQDESGGVHMASLVPQEGSSVWTALVRKESRSL